MVELERNHLGPRARLLIVAEALASLLECARLLNDYLVDARDRLEPLHRSRAEINEYVPRPLRHVCNGNTDAFGAGFGAHEQRVGDEAAGREGPQQRVDRLRCGFVFSKQADAVA